ncbi:MAG: hypothetical protein GY833_22015 [Aestuariibacter sp.]|nr:hypothetical protein [Aestuariibacter sp.]|tara:strand:+ start:71697 stop:72284 length:588 start_codon:yes stop_codon:yes gene_type:complete
MTNEFVSVFSARGIERIIKEGGTQAWVLDPRRAKRADYAVVIQNRSFANEGNDWGGVSAPHKHMFVIGKIKDVIKLPKRHANHAQRYSIQFSEYAEIDLKSFLTANRNPVRYTQTDELSNHFDLDALAWKAMPAPTMELKVDDEDLNQEERETGDSTETTQPTADETPLTIPEAKRRLALTLGVSPDDIRITIES